MSYKAIKIEGRKIDLHRHIVKGYLAINLSFNDVVHHKDENKWNNDPDNFQIVSRSEHSRMHMTGRKLSTATKSKMRRIGRALRTGAKLTIESVIEIKHALAKGEPGSSIAERFKISRPNVSDIKTGRKWGWVKIENDLVL